MAGLSAFDGLMGTLDYPMFIVTTGRDDARSGCLVGFVTQTSIRPSRFLVCLSVKNHTFSLARDAPRLAVHFVPSDADALAQLFGGETGDEIDKFARCAWHEGPYGLPILEECENWFVGAVVDHVAFGDHVGFLLEPEVVRYGTAGRPFTFHRAKRIEAGHEA